MKYVIKNKKTNSYYSKTLTDNIFHFVRYIYDAKIFYKEEDAYKVIEQFKHKENYEVIER